MHLLSVNRDAKTSKGQKYGVLTGILYLAPANVSGFQVCPKATEGCKAACLFTAGHGIYKNVQNARIAKTVRFFKEREAFLHDLVDDIASLERKAKREGMKPAVRLNGTSDIAWEKFKVTKDGKVYANIFDAFPKIMFYDYTAILGRKAALNHKNYFLTFSLKENNDKEAVKALAEGFNVSVVLNVKRSAAKPTQWGGYPVIDGDVSDIRFKDKKGGHIIALTAKGKARYDSTGFVRSIGDRLNA